ncbi:MAG: collagen-like protein [Planctomycetes bacterium]|nr:collagen-like protein [Planctomycetota bacterium]
MAVKIMKNENKSLFKLIISAFICLGLLASLLQAGILVEQEAEKAFCLGDKKIKCFIWDKWDLDVSQSPRRNSFIYFDLEHLSRPEEIESAILSLHVSDVKKSGLLHVVWTSVAISTDNPETETPPLGTIIVDSIRLNKCDEGKNLEINVTAIIKDKIKTGNYGFSLEATEGLDASFSGESSIFEHKYYKRTRSKPTLALIYSTLIGQDGEKGDKGDTGAQGPIGATGAQGEKGDKGDTGAQGPIGATGAQGEKGDKGDTGAQGPIGATGAQGPIGATGVQGPAGIQGPKGDSGLSAAEVPGITLQLGILRDLARKDLTANSFTDIPDRVLSINKANSDSLLKITYEDSIGTISTTSSVTCVWRVLVDGVVQGRSKYWIQSVNAGINVSNRVMTWTLSGIPAGQHTISIQGMQSGASLMLHGYPAGQVENLLSASEIR